MAVQNSQLAGLILAGIFAIALLGLTIWQRIKYPKRQNQKSDPIAEAEVYIAYGRKKKQLNYSKRLNEKTQIERILARNWMNYQSNPNPALQQTALSAA
ncbi:hypothetical protein [Methylomonas sp. ZR1]|uniref:hypothetical protein n=1 Tax=Methylomonas sp. ZR1 TaxID=1797072 RepID=UPI001491F9DD|nr:hypothetical protein [Methylomonas sp. ZR1]NOV29563.1 hypothetical protein [Methylomonas sp. ZR1]